MVVKQRQVRRTLLIVGEGDSEEAFLKHLRNLYCSSGAGVTVTVRNAHGKGPDNVITHTVRQTRIASYDRRVALLDTDIPWTEELEKKAQNAKIYMVGSKPCFEGLLLSILGMSVPSQSGECKKVIAQTLGFDLTERQSYINQFSKTILDSARVKIPELNQLINFFEGNWQFK
ncbi:MAG: RloB domain-containing protein [Proteobacteria bacterium]|nr:RloB domain-containing protein [Pseudomonadota bacterium]